MAKKTAFDDLFSDDFGKLGLQRLEELNAMALTLKENLKASAQTLSAKVRGASPSTASGAKEIENTKKEVEALKKQSEELAKIEEKLRKEREKAHDNENKKRAQYLKDQEKAQRDYQKMKSDALKQESKEFKDVEKAVINAEKAKKKAFESTAAYKLEIQRQNQLNKENAILESEKSTQYEKNVVLLNRLSKQIMALGGTDKAPKELADEFNRLFGEVKNAEESVKRFQRNVGNYASATAELKALTKQLIDLELAGQRDSAAFREMQKRAAELKDTISDTKAEISNMASDTKTIDGLVGSVNLLANGFQVFEGVMALTGQTSEEWKETMVKLQAIMAVTTGLQEVQNLLQKESAAMMFLNSIQTKAAAAAQSLYAFATGGATTATKAFRIALLSTGIGAIIVLLASAADAMDLFTESTDEATEAQKKFNEEQANARRAEESIRDRYEARRELSRKQLEQLKSDIEEEENAIEKANAEIIGKNKRRAIDEAEQIKTRNKIIKETETDLNKFRNLYSLEDQRAIKLKIDGLKEQNRQSQLVIDSLKNENPELEYKRKQIEEINKLLNKEDKSSTNRVETKRKEVNIIKESNQEKVDNEWLTDEEMYRIQEEQFNEQLKALEEYEKNSSDIKDDSKEKDIAREKEAFERRKQFAQQALQYMQQISEEMAKAKIDSIDKELNASQERENSLKQLAQQGQLNAQQSIALEDKRQSELEAKREKAVKRQREQAIILAGIEAFIASARAGSVNPSGDATNQVNGLLSNLEGALNKIKAFEKGGLVDGGEQLVRINEKGEEFVVKHDAVNKYGEQMLYDINEGRFNPLDYVSTPSMNSVNYSEPIATAVVSELREVKEAIRTKPVPSWSVSEITKGVREDIREGNNLLRKHYERGNKLF